MKQFRRFRVLAQEPGLFPFCSALAVLATRSVACLWRLHGEAGSPSIELTQRKVVFARHFVVFKAALEALPQIYCAILCYPAELMAPKALLEDDPDAVFGPNLGRLTASMSQFGVNCGPVSLLQ